MPTNLPTEPTSRAQLFHRLLYDASLSPRAFKLMHYLLDHVNPRRGDWLVWPGYRSMCHDLGFRPDQVVCALAELEAGGWLVVYRSTPAPGKTKSGRGSKYGICDGHGNPMSEVGNHYENHYGIRKRTATDFVSGPLRKTETKLVYTLTEDGREIQPPAPADAGQEAESPPEGGEDNGDEVDL